MQIITLKQIHELLQSENILPAIEAGFVAYSNNKAVVPPVGELIFTDPPGEVHIKSGYIKEDDYYIIKIASGFYQNQRYNLPNNNGLMLLFSQKTGALLSLLLDEGYLTALRTAAAGAIVAKYLAPRVVHKIGMIGTGTQARLQLRLLKSVVSCQQVVLFGRDSIKLLRLREELEQEGYDVHCADSVDFLAAECNLIITTTASTQPFLFANQVQKGTHITAVGSDTPDKQEVDTSVFKLADTLVVDSTSQCILRGDTAHAIKAGIISSNDVHELGQIIQNPHLARTHDDQITLADLTGLAIQDLQIAKRVSALAGILHF